MDPSSRDDPPHVEPSAQGDGSPDPVYTVDPPEFGLQVRLTVQRAPASWPGDETESVEAGYGHGV
jgi:hypothetical protein